MNSKLAFFIAGLLVWARLVGAQVPVITKQITIKPSAPTANWQIELPPLASARLIVTVIPTEDIGSVTYVLKSGPTAKITPSAGNTVLWTPIAVPVDTPPGSISFAYVIVNTASQAGATTTAEVKCVWGPKPGTGTGGGGTPPLDIDGLATAIASLALTGSCAWSFDRTVQIANGVNDIQYRATIVNTAGTPVAAKFTKIEAVNVAPATVLWSIDPSSGEAPPPFPRWFDLKFSPLHRLPQSQLQGAGDQHGRANLRIGNETLFR